MTTIKEKKVKRGEIYLYDFGTNEGSIQIGVRPVLIIQCDEGNSASTTTIVAAMTRVAKRTYLPTHIILDNGLESGKPSMVMLEQIKTVNQSDLIRCIGKVEDAETERYINKAIRVGLGLVDFSAKPKDEIRCLCPKCLSDYRSIPNIIVKRLNPYNKTKDKCDRCNAYGYDYVIYEKNSKGGTHNV